VKKVVRRSIKIITLNKKIYLSPPHLTGEESGYIQDALLSNWIAPVGPHVDAFEQELAEVLKIQHVLTVNSGTSAIHLGLLALGVTPGDEVLCSTLTFCASANPIVYCGALPVFIDSEPNSWNMDPVLLEEAILDRLKKTGRKPKLILLVHLYGMPANMKEISRISEQYQIPILEDAAEALGSTYNGKALGTFGAAGILSFNGNKIITTSGGGALVSENTKLIDRARYLRQDAKEPLPYYEHKEIGYNYRFSNVLAALGRSQLKALGQRVERRREIFEYYQQELSAHGIRFQPEEKTSVSNRWLTAIILGSGMIREKLRLALEAEQIESRPVWKPMHLQPVFSNCTAYVNGTAEALFTAGLCLSSGTAMQQDDLERIVHHIHTALQ
jgi:dTDP-4-amino-4,6-dideoxygalactose transaminase